MIIHIHAVVFKLYFMGHYGAWNISPLVSDEA